MAGFLLLHCVAANGGLQKPNLVLILVDNVGYGDLGCYGNKAINTPHIDHLAEQGVRCSDFYIGSPSCMPSRGALLTGRHPVRNGLNEQVYLIDELEQRVLSPHEKLSSEFQRWYEDARHESDPPDVASAVRMVQCVQESSQSSGVNGRHRRRESP